MKKSHILIACLLTFNGLSTGVADTILGVDAGANYWQHDLADDVDSGLSDSKRSGSGNVFYLALEHPLPFLPNIKLQQNNIKGQETGFFQFLDEELGLVDISAVSKVDLSHTNYTLYYEVLDNWLNLDLGLSLKQFDGFATFYNQAQSAGRKDLDDWVPLLYGKGQIDLPLTGFSAFGSIETLSIGSNDVTDLEIGLSYASKSGLGGVLGYRALDVEFEKSNHITAAAQADGFFVGINYHF